MSNNCQHWSRYASFALPLPFKGPFTGSPKRNAVDCCFCDKRSGICARGVTRVAGFAHEGKIDRDGRRRCIARFNAIAARRMARAWASKIYARRRDEQAGKEREQCRSFIARNETILPGPNVSSILSSRGYTHEPDLLYSATRRWRSLVQRRKRFIVYRLHPPLFPPLPLPFP